MQQKQLDFAQEFRVELGNQHAQAAAMVLAPGTSTGGPDNRHPESDQWLYVISGKGTVLVSGEEVSLEPEVLVLIERGETHEIRNPGDEPLRTLNLYVPPAYG